jgi:hypothetical protein
MTRPRLWPLFILTHFVANVIVGILLDGSHLRHNLTTTMIYLSVCIVSVAFHTGYWVRRQRLARK